jgi:protein-disulfide isomerase
LVLLLAAVAAGCGEGKPEPGVAPAASGAAAPVPATSASPATTPPTAPATAPTALAPKVAAAEVGPEVGQRIPAFSATVRRFGADGAKESAYDSHAAKGIVAYVFNSTTCPYCIKYVDRMKALEGAYLGRSVDLVHVYPNRKEPLAEKLAFHATNFKAAQIVDADASIARVLKIQKTPTVVVTDAAGTIVYRGRVDDAQDAADVKVRHLAETLDLVLAGKPVAVKTTDPFG